MQALIEALSQHPTLALGAVFAGALLESVAVVGFVVPGSLMVFGGGVLIGLQVLGPGWTALAAIAGAALGDGFNYWLGRHYQDRLRHVWPLRSRPELLDRAQAHFVQNGGKSVFLGRFIGPLRAIVPVVAGMSNMSALRFTVVNVLSAVAWAVTHLVPGALFGASLQLAGAVSSRLLALLAGLVLAVWLTMALLRLAQRAAVPRLSRQRDRVVAWASPRAGFGPRVILSLLDPARPESLALLVAAGLILGGTWLFLGTLEDVVSNDPLVQFDQVVFATLQELRTAWADQAMIFATELGSAPVAVSVLVAVSATFAWKRCWRTLAYWLAAIGFAQALVLVLKLTLGRARPIAMYDGLEQFSFPSGHAAISIVLFGFLAFLVSLRKPAKLGLVVSMSAALLIGVISFSRLYLGASWLSDTLASLGLGSAWVALLGVAYAQHARDEPVPARAATLAALVALVLAATGVFAARHAANAGRYAQSAPAPVEMLDNWTSVGWKRLPARRTEVGGKVDEPLSLQWAGTADEIERLLQIDGWRRPTRWWSKSTLLWLVPSIPIGQLPVLAKLHHGDPQTLSFEKELDAASRLVIRLWSTPYRVNEADDAPVPLWVGAVTLEQLRRPGGIVSLALTDGDSAAPLAQLAQQLKSHGVAFETRHRDVSDVLLIR